MSFIYFLFNVASVLLSNYFYKKWFNPVSLYCVVWSVAMLVHQSGLITYYALEPFTWLVIFSLQTVFVASCFLATKLKCTDEVAEIKSNTEILATPASIQKKMEIYILLTSVISGIAIIGDFISVVSVYGWDVLTRLNEIYSDRVHGNADLTTIPYLGSFVFIATSLAGAYSKKFGFKLIVFLPLLLGGVRSFTTGGRAGLIFIGVIFVCSYLCYTNPNETNNNSWFSRNSKIVLASGCVFLAVVLFLITSKRSAGGDTTYATQKFYRLFGENAVIYNLLTYVGSPIGALNQYLKTCDFNFGQNTFLPVFNLLAKFGIIDRINQYQKFFSTPYSCNVATWFRELIEDFTLWGAIVAVITFGVGTSFVYQKSQQRQSVQYGIVWSILAVVVALSFFDWKLRSAEFWISLFFGYIIGKRIDRASIQ